MLPKHLFDGVLTLITLALGSAIFLLVTVVAGAAAAITKRRRAKIVAVTSGAMAAGAGATCLLLADLWNRNMATTELDYRDWGAPPAAILFVIGVVALFRVR